MRRTSRFAGALLFAGLLLVGLAPSAAAEAPQSAKGWVSTLGPLIASWLAAVTGEKEGRRGVSAASELAPSIDPDGQDLAPSIDPDGLLAPSVDPNGNELAPSVDPNG